MNGFIRNTQSKRYFRKLRQGTTEDIKQAHVYTKEEFDSIKTERPLANVEFVPSFLYKQTH